MKTPEGMTEQEVLDIIDNIANRLAYKFKFGYHTVEDMKQQARLYALQKIDKYDGKRPLENFLWTCVRNLLFNNKRDNYERPDLPCLNCPLNAHDPYCDKSTSGCLDFADKASCELYAKWMKRNSAKKNLMAPITFGNVVDEKEDGMKTSVELDKQLDLKTFFEIIEEDIPLEFKADLIRLKHEISIPKIRREKVYRAVRAILEERGLNEPEAW